MKINNVQTSITSAALQKTDSKLSRVLERLSTSLRINRASDDAAGLSVSENLRTQIRGFEMANTNISYASAAQNIAEGTGNQVTSILQRQRELALQASNGTMTAENRQTLNTEYQALNEELTRISDGAQFNTQNVANGQGLGAGGGTVQAGPNAGSNLSIQGADFTAASLGTAPTDILNPANATNAVNALDAALASTANQRTNIGANINRMDYAYSNNQNSAAMTQSAEERMRDFDMAEGVMERTTQSLLNQSATSALRNFNEINRNSLMALLNG
ncbi:MAG: flagellin [Fibrobacteres bacterium]|nr:flagellin [Fibrobacterota bacterium]